MKLNKMWLDSKPNKNPLGTSRANRNIIIDKRLDAVVNEKGNLVIPEYGVNRKLIGVIVLQNNDSIVFTKPSNTTSEIGYVSADLRYTSLINAPNLAFDETRPIHGEFQIDAWGNTIVVYTDGEELRYFIKEKVSEYSDVRKVFEDYKRGNVDSRIETGGDLPAGAFYPIYRYEQDDKIVSSWFKDYNPIFISTAKIDSNALSTNDVREGSDSGVLTDKQIRLVISDLNTNVKRLQIGLVYQNKGVRQPYFLKTVDIGNGTVVTVINSIKGGQPFDLDELIIDRANYKKVKNITQLENILYLQDLEVNREPNIQSLISRMRFKWSSTLLNFVGGISNRTQNFIDHNVNNKVRHFQHGEVYALYARIEWKWGFGQWRTIPGRTALAGEMAVIENGFKKFQLTDTCLPDGTLGYWENESELYPSDDFPIGNVRHFKMPSIRWMKQNIYNNDPLYGGRKLDILNIVLDPNSFDLSDFVDCEGNPAVGYQIGYAKRSDTNGIVVGQSIFVASNKKVDTVPQALKSLGFNATYFYDNRRVNLDLANLRVYDLKNLYNKEAPNINYIRDEVVLTTGIDFLDSTKAPATSKVRNDITVGVADFTGDNVVTMADREYIGVNKSKFIINNTLRDNVNNTYLEDTVLLELATPIVVSTVPELAGIFANNLALQVETHLLTLLSIKKNCYSEYFNQTVIPCDGNYTTGVFGGDTYINVTNINTFGILPFTDEYTTDPSAEEDINSPANGIRIANLFLAESRYNFGFRYTNPATVGGSTKHYPIDDPVMYLPNLRRDQEPNLIIQGYSTDFNAENDITFNNVYNPYSTPIYRDKFAITRTAPISAESNISTWLNVKINDIYHLDKTSGDVVFLGAGKGYLIIHHENALFRTRVRAYIPISGGEAYVGQGDIFENPPEPVVYDKLGALGTQHRWSCIVSKYGYFWFDSENKRYFRYDGQVSQLSENGLAKFFQDNSFCAGDNPFNSFGVHSVIDEENERLLLTKKHTRLTAEYQKRFKGVWKNDQNFINSLENGDIVVKNGKLLVVS